VPVGAEVAHRVVVGGRDQVVVVSQPVEAAPVVMGVREVSIGGVVVSADAVEVSVEWIVKGVTVRVVTDERQTLVVVVGSSAMVLLAVEEAVEDSSQEVVIYLAVLDDGILLLVVVEVLVLLSSSSHGSLVVAASVVVTDTVVGEVVIDWALLVLETWSTQGLRVDEFSSVIPEAVVLVELSIHDDCVASETMSEVDDAHGVVQPMLRRLEEWVVTMDVFQPWCPVEHVVFMKGISVDDVMSESGAVMVVVACTVVVTVVTPKLHPDLAAEAGWLVTKLCWEELEVSLNEVAVVLSAELRVLLALWTGRLQGCRGLCWCIVLWKRCWNVVILLQSLDVQEVNVLAQRRLPLARFLHRQRALRRRCSDAALS
jgi:hypothetical protein